MTEKEVYKQGRGWFLALGMLLIALGVAVISSSFYTTLLSVRLLGFFLTVAGIAQIIQAFFALKWKGLFFTLLLGGLYLAAGIAGMAYPERMAVSLTLWIAAFCFVVGLVRMLLALIFRHEQWAWAFTSGLVTFALGIMIYFNWPLSGLWVIGLFIGVDMILSGLSWMAFSLKSRTEP